MSVQKWLGGECQIGFTTGEDGIEEITEVSLYFSEKYCPVTLNVDLTEARIGRDALTDFLLKLSDKIELLHEAQEENNRDYEI